PSDWPGLAEADSLRHLPMKRIESLENAFAADIGDARLIPYIQLHEYEAYLFSDPQWFGYFYPSEPKAVTAIKEIADAFESPEQINDGPHTAPSKRIIEHLPDYEDAKAVIGPQIAELIGLPTIRAKCPHFNGWVTRLEALANSR